MSLFNRINRLTSNVLSGARQLASSVYTRISPKKSNRFW